MMLISSENTQKGHHFRVSCIIIVFVVEEIWVIEFTHLLILCTHNNKQSLTSYACGTQQLILTVGFS